jgi:hypothetical protein
VNDRERASNTRRRQNDLLYLLCRPVESALLARRSLYAR